MIQTLLEVQARKFMTNRELVLRNQLVKLLRSNHHAKYAQRLSLFDVNIVSLKADPKFTAAISFDTGTIFISEGFLKDPKTFNQLDMLMRHELSHNLLMHQIRMTKKIGEEIFPELGPTMSMHDLLNTIEDFDISNTRYTDADKELVRHTWLNGREFSGLVTEDVRKDWADLSLEEMYEKLSAELEDIKNYILNDRAWQVFMGSNDHIKNTALASGTFNYMLNRKNPSSLTVPAEDFMKGKGGFYDPSGALIAFKDFPETFQKVFTKLYEIVTDPNSFYADKANLEQLIEDITKSNVTDPFDVVQKDTTGKEDHSNHILIISPEEKWFALDLLKSMVGRTALTKKPIVHVKPATHSKEYRDIYNKIIKGLSNSSDEDLDQAMSDLNN